jgi:hypothetical protein
MRDDSGLHCGFKRNISASLYINPNYLDNQYFDLGSTYIKGKLADANAVINPLKGV